MNYNNNKTANKLPFSYSIQKTSRPQYACKFIMFHESKKSKFHFNSKLEDDLCKNANLLG